MSPALFKKLVQSPCVDAGLVRRSVFQSTTNASAAAQSHTSHRRMLSCSFQTPDHPSQHEPQQRLDRSVSREVACGANFTSMMLPLLYSSLPSNLSGPQSTSASADLVILPVTSSNCQQCRMDEVRQHVHQQNGIDADNVDPDPMDTLCMLSYDEDI